MLLMIIFIVLHLWCIMCARMEDTKEESGVGSPLRAAHVDTSRPRKGWGVLGNRCSPVQLLMSYTDEPVPIWTFLSLEPVELDEDKAHGIPKKEELGP